MSETEAIEPIAELVEPTEPSPEPAPTPWPLDHKGPETFTLKQKAIMTAIAVIIALLSAFPIANALSSPEFHSSSINALDNRRNTVLALTGAAAVTSTAISALPEDIGTPLADKLMDLVGDFGIILAAIVLEKYLLSITGIAAFKILIPLALLIVVASIWIPMGAPMREKIRTMAAKVALLGIALFIVVPASLGLSGVIESTYAASTNETLASAEAAAITESVEEATTATETADSDQTETGNFVDGIANMFSGLVDNATKAASNALSAGSEALSKAQNLLNDLLEGFAVMIVTSCIIPILVMAFFIWMINAILGVNIPMPKRMLHPKSLHRTGKKA